MGDMRDCACCGSTTYDNDLCAHCERTDDARQAQIAALQARADAAEGRVGELLAAVRTQREHSRIGHGCDVDRDGLCAVWAEADRQIVAALAAAPSVGPGGD